MEKMLVLTESWGTKFKVAGVAALSKRSQCEEWRQADPVNRDIWEVEVVS